MTLTVGEVQEMLGIGRNQAYALVKQEGFPSVRVGRRILVPRGAFADWMREHARAKARRTRARQGSTSIGLTNQR